MLSVIIPANNEEQYLGACLEALLASDDPGPPVEIVVAANACTDRTVAIAQGFEAAAAARGWRLLTLDIAEPGKANALDRADAAATPLGPGGPGGLGGARVYVDADVAVSAALLAALAAALDRDAPAYASGRLRVARAESWVTRAYARIWVRLPFMTKGVPGAGVFAVNAAGRARWGTFPRIISDDTFVRLSFTPEERLSVAAPYDWPMVEGFSNLVKVRHRQDVGVAEVAAQYPEKLANDDKHRVTPSLLARLALTDPIGLAVYLGVAVAVRLKGREAEWNRGR